MLKKPLLVLSLIFIGCSQNAKTPVIKVTMINNSVQFSGLDKAVLNDINRNLIPNVWETLLPVYKLPADTDLKNYQPLQHGMYILKDNAVVFTPDTPFVKNKVYFMRFYQFNKGNTIWDFIKGKHTQGNTHYSDLEFKY